MEKGTDKGKTNIYSFYDIILLFKSIQGGRAQIFFNFMLQLLAMRKDVLGY